MYPSAYTVDSEPVYEGEGMMEWDDERQARLDALRTAELAGTLDEAAKAELARLIESVEAEERERLVPALVRMRAKQATLRQQVQESEAASTFPKAGSFREGGHMLTDAQKR